MSESDDHEEVIDANFLLHIPIAELEDRLLSLRGVQGFGFTLKIVSLVAVDQISNAQTNETRTHGVRLLDLVQRVRSLA